MLSRDSSEHREQLDLLALRLDELLGAGRVMRDRPIGELTTYRVGGRASLFVEVSSKEELGLLAEALGGADVPLLVLGRGSNVLVTDCGFKGLVITLGPEFASLVVTGEHVSTGASLPMPQLARRTAALGLSGVQWAVGIPGSVGGAVFMNAGCHGSQMSEWLTSACVVDLSTGETVDVATAELGYGYRHSALRGSQVVVSAEFDLIPADREGLAEEMATIVKWRRSHQPGGSNAGSVFQNPPGDSAGRLVEASGLKGFRHGSASVSSKHANFVQADDGGCASDVQAVVEHVRSVVHERFGVLLELELRVMGVSDAICGCGSTGFEEAGELYGHKAQVEAYGSGRSEGTR
ncbi:MAG: UDP-N-acetylmuramate dehydrogenase [Acidimicrobiales bacterium]